MKPDWKRIAGLHYANNDIVAAVWLAHDPQTDVLHVYDSCVFKREVMAVIAEGMNARGRWIPIAWTDKGLKEALYKRGCKFAYEPADDSIAELVSREIDERIRTGRFKVDKRLKDWQEEYKTFRRADNEIPEDSHPLMAATRHAISSMRAAKAQQPATGRKTKKRTVAIV